VHAGGKTKSVLAKSVFDGMPRHPRFQGRDGRWRYTTKQFKRGDLIDLRKRSTNQSEQLINRYLKKKQEKATRGIGLTKASILSGGRSAGLNVVASDPTLENLVQRGRSISDGKKFDTGRTLTYVVKNSSPRGKFARTQSALTRAIRSRIRLFMRSIKSSSYSTLKKLTQNFPGLTFNPNNFNE
jgi:hypothetical protein